MNSVRPRWSSPNDHQASPLGTGAPEGWASLPDGSWVLESMSQFTDGSHRVRVGTTLLVPLLGFWASAVPQHKDPLRDGAKQAAVRCSPSPKQPSQTLTTVLGTPSPETICGESARSTWAGDRAVLLPLLPLSLPLAPTATGRRDPRSLLRHRRVQPLWSLMSPTCLRHTQRLPGRGTSPSHLAEGARGCRFCPFSNCFTNAPFGRGRPHRPGCSPLSRLPCPRV